MNTYPLLSNRSYDILKRIVTVVLPGLGALYFALAQIWGLPMADQVVGTISAVNVFLGVVLGISTKAYNNSDVRFDGEVDVVEENDGKKTFVLALYNEPDQLQSMDEVRFKVNKK